MGQDDPFVKSSDPGKRQKVTKTDWNVYQYISINYSSSQYGLHPILVGLYLTWAKKKVLSRNYPRFSTLMSGDGLQIDKKLIE